LKEYISSADPMNVDFGVINATDPEAYIFWTLQYSHICRHM
jgi:hypothetical protein